MLRWENLGRSLALSIWLKMNTIDVSILEAILQTIIKKIPARDIDFYRLWLSCEVLRLLVGNEWANQAIFRMHTEKPKLTREARDFLGTESLWISRQTKVQLLAEKLYNLQSIRHVNRIVNEILDGNMGSRFYELEFWKYW